MKNLNKNPLAWFILTIVVGYISVENNSLEYFFIFISGVILAKLTEIIIKLEK